MLGVVISKLEPHRGGPLRGYIAMLAVKKEHRGKGIATRLVRMALDIMIERDAEEVSYSSNVRRQKLHSTDSDRFGDRGYQYCGNETV